MAETDINTANGAEEQNEPLKVILDHNKKSSEEHEELKESINYLQDLFIRRLNEDKQKTEMITQLKKLSSFAIIEPFVSDLLLVLDRIEQSDDDFAISIGEELIDILRRRGVEVIEANGRFNPAVHKSVRVIDDEMVCELTVTQVIRNGYTFAGKVIRPAEVIVARPHKPDSVMI